MKDEGTLRMTEKITTDNGEYWNNFYKKNTNFTESTFCNEICNNFHSNKIVVDIGCGTGRDSFAFASKGFEVYAIDGSQEAISANSKRVEELCLNGEVFFSKVELSNRIDLQELFLSISAKAKASNKKIVLYLRFLLHAIDDQVEKILLDTIEECLPTGTYFTAEFRSTEDANRSKVYDDHYRRFVDSDKLLVELLNRGFSIKEFYKGTGLSIYKEEDPFLARVFAKKF